METFKSVIDDHIMRCEKTINANPDAGNSKIPEGAIKVQALEKRLCDIVADLRLAQKITNAENARVDRMNNIGNAFFSTWKGINDSVVSIAPPASSTVANCRAYKSQMDEALAQFDKTEANLRREATSISSDAYAMTLAMLIRKMLVAEIATLLPTLDIMLNELETDSWCARNALGFMRAIFHGQEFSYASVSNAPCITCNFIYCRERDVAIAVRLFDNDQCMDCTVTAQTAPNALDEAVWASITTRGNEPGWWDSNDLAILGQKALAAFIPDIAAKLSAQ
jgi:hypothetical protein